METTNKYPNGRYCVFQPFDKNVFDKRFEDVLTPAIEAVGMEPYRVDRDLGSTIPVDTLHHEIRSAAICIADITTRNPNVMYELGFAIAANKDVVIISAPSIEKYPFDIQHRGIIAYEVGSPSDFKNLEQLIKAKLSAILDRQEKTTNIAELSPVKSNDGLQAHELTALALLMANSNSVGDYLAANWIKEEMRKAGYTEVGARLALARLVKLGYATSDVERDYDNDPFVVYRTTEKGEDWLLENQSLLELRTPKKLHQFDEEIREEDIPF